MNKENVRFTKTEKQSIFLVLSCGASVMCEDFPRCSDDPNAGEIRQVISKIKDLSDCGYNFFSSKEFKDIPQQGIGFLVNVAKGYDSSKTYEDTLKEKVNSVTQKYEALFSKENRKRFERFIKNESSYTTEIMEITEKVFSTFGLRDSEILFWSLSNKGVDNGK